MLSVGNIIGGIKFSFGGGTAKLQEEIRKINDSHDELLSAIAEINKFSGQIVIMLHKRDALSTEELAEFIKHHTELAYPNLMAALSHAKKSNNPLTPEEADALEKYIDKAKHGMPFADYEINHYRELVEKAEQEQTELNTWPLIALGGFLLGLWLGSQKKNQ